MRHSEGGTVMWHPGIVDGCLVSVDETDILMSTKTTLPVETSELCIADVGDKNSRSRESIRQNWGVFGEHVT